MSPDVPSSLWDRKTRVSPREFLGKKKDSLWGPVLGAFVEPRERAVLLGAPGPVRGRTPSFGCSTPRGIGAELEVQLAGLVGLAA